RHSTFDKFGTVHFFTGPMSARFCWNQRNTRGHRPRLQGNAVFPRLQFTDFNQGLIIKFHGRFLVWEMKRCMPDWAAMMRLPLLPITCWAALWPIRDWAAFGPIEVKTVCGVRSSFSSISCAIPLGGPCTTPAGT